MPFHLLFWTNLLKWIYWTLGNKIGLLLLAIDSLLKH